MVSLSLLKYLEQNGFGMIDQNLFWEKMGLGEDGVYITSLGGNRERGTRNSETYELYCRASSDVAGYQTLQKIADFLNASYNVCELPAVPPVTDYGYGNVAIMPVSAITNVGVDINGRAIFSLTGQVYYGEKRTVGTDPPTPPVTDGDKITTETDEILLTENNQEIITEK